MSANNARIALAVIRLFYGLGAILIPKQVARRLVADPDQHKVMFYALRMFGVRTFVLGLELLSHDEHTRTRALRSGPLIHASDTVAAAIAGLRGQLAPRRALVAVTISGVNTCLALSARGSRGVDSHRRTTTTRN